MAAPSGWIEARRPMLPSSGEFYYQTRFCAQSYCQQRDASVSHGNLEKLVPTIWQQLFEWEAAIYNGCMQILHAKVFLTKGCRCVSQEAREAGADYRMLQDMRQTNNNRMPTCPRRICNQRQNASRPV
ncbi:hypothetical protein CFC21_075915 [Triticum aestivum]|uniref:Uncharacterized protein n=2 Tax=Triticum aestivum TaxID=4565 RepID=A0A9R1HQX6_WHEAT|nr:hypothetical protein CFC21_075913 [Triticum aestivum]KAF7070392.1 hypothetical protein CFC21_075915 [Triticum aestivum]